MQDVSLNKKLIRKVENNHGKLQRLIQNVASISKQSIINDSKIYCGERLKSSMSLIDRESPHLTSRHIWAFQKSQTQMSLNWQTARPPSLFTALFKWASPHDWESLCLGF